VNMKMKFLDKINTIFKKFLFRFLFLKNIPFFKLVLILGVILGTGLFLLFNLSTLLPKKSGWEDYLQKADKLYQEGELDKAKKIYLELREKFSSNPRMDWVNYQLANSFRRSGFIHRASFFYEKVTAHLSFMKKLPPRVLPLITLKLSITLPTVIRKQESWIRL